jgi:hypothetical protein
VKLLAYIFFAMATAFVVKMIAGMFSVGALLVLNWLVGFKSDRLDRLEPGERVQVDTRQARFVARAKSQARLSEDEPPPGTSRIGGRSSLAMRTTSGIIAPDA